MGSGCTWEINQSDGLLWSWYSVLCKICTRDHFSFEALIHLLIHYYVRNCVLSLWLLPWPFAPFKCEHIIAQVNELLIYFYTNSALPASCICSHALSRTLTSPAGKHPMKKRDNNLRIVYQPPSLIVRAILRKKKVKECKTLATLRKTEPPKWHNLGGGFTCNWFRWPVIKI